MADLKVDEHSMALLVLVCGFIERRDFTSAKRVVLDLLNSVKGDHEKWALGVKRVVDLLEKS